MLAEAVLVLAALWTANADPISKALNKDATENYGILPDLKNSFPVIPVLLVPFHAFNYGGLNDAGNYPNPFLGLLPGELPKVEEGKLFDLDGGNETSFYEPGQQTVDDDVWDTAVRPGKNDEPGSSAEEGSPKLDEATEPENEPESSAEEGSPKLDEATEPKNEPGSSAEEGSPKLDEATEPKNEPGSSAEEGSPKLDEATEPENEPESSAEEGSPKLDEATESKNEPESSAEEGSPKLDEATEPKNGPESSAEDGSPKLDEATEPKNGSGSSAEDDSPKLVATERKNGLEDSSSEDGGNSPESEEPGQQTVDDDAWDTAVRPGTNYETGRQSVVDDAWDIAVRPGTNDETGRQTVVDDAWDTAVRPGTNDGEAENPDKKGSNPNTYGPEWFLASPHALQLLYDGFYQMPDWEVDELPEETYEWAKKFKKARNCKPDVYGFLLQLSPNVTPGPWNECVPKNEEGGDYGNLSSHGNLSSRTKSNDISRNLFHWLFGAGNEKVHNDNGDADGFLPYKHELPTKTGVIEPAEDQSLRQILAAALLRVAKQVYKQSVESPTSSEARDETTGYSDDIMGRIPKGAVPIHSYPVDFGAL